MKALPLGFRAVIAFVMLPCVFAGLIPWLIVWQDQAKAGGVQFAALVPMLSGFAILLGAVRDFLVRGRGTLSPWDPPKRLVVAGLYRFVRNPMYVGITLFLLGWCWLTGSPWLMLYTAILTVGFHLRIVLYEEPILARSFPDDWPIYQSAVRRWIPRVRRWKESDVRADQSGHSSEMKQPFSR